jgi:hypothetical protein
MDIQVVYHLRWQAAPAAGDARNRRCRAREKVTLSHVAETGRDRKRSFI